MNSTIKPLMFLCLLVILFSSCEKVVDLKVSEPQKQVAVEGFITNHEGKSYVKLQWTRAYFSDATPVAVTDAVVNITDNAGNSTAFVETAPGMYTCPTSFVGMIDKTYHLDVQYEGGILQAKSTMPDTTQVMTMELIKATNADPKLQEGYHLFGMLHNQPSVKNYYKAEVFINGEKKMTTAEDLMVFDDKYFGEEEFVTGVLAYWGQHNKNQPQVGDVLSLRLYSLDLPGYNYLLALSETPTQGGLFGKNPANVPSNIEGGLGLFQATSYTISEKMVVLE